MHVDGVRGQRGFAAGDGHRLHLVEDDDGRHAVVRLARNGFTQQVRHELLGLAVLSAHEPVGVDLDEADRTGENVSELVGEPLGHRGLAGSRRSVEEQQAVKRGGGEGQPASDGEREGSVVQQSLLNTRRGDDRVPLRREIRVRREDRPCDGFFRVHVALPFLVGATFGGPVVTHTVVNTSRHCNDLALCFVSTTTGDKEEPR